jgi:hypothetical protein
MIRGPLLRMAEGGGVKDSIAQIYQQALGRPADKAGLDWYTSQVQSGAKTLNDVAADLAYIGNAAKAVDKLYLEQLGRPADSAGREFYANKILAGEKTPQRIAEELDRTREGFDYDTENITAAYRQAFARNPDQKGYQFYMGQEDKELKTSKQIADQIKAAAGGVDKQALIDNPQGFLEFTSEALRADPRAGMTAVQDPYIFDEARLKVVGGLPNISETAAGQFVQYVSPVTEQPIISGYTDDGKFEVRAGNDVLQPDRVYQVINLAEKSGSLSKADGDRLRAAVSNAQAFATETGISKPEEETLYALLADPKAKVILDKMGVQIGEDAARQNALDESIARQMMVDETRKYTGLNVNPSAIMQEHVTAKLQDPNYVAPFDLSKVSLANRQQIEDKLKTDDYTRLINAGANADIDRLVDSSGNLIVEDYPFTQTNLNKDPRTGDDIKTFVTQEDVLKNLLTELGIDTDKVIKNVFQSGLSLPGGGTPTEPPAVVGTAGDFRGLAFPQARPEVIGETPAMLGFQPYSITSAGSGQQKTTEPQPVVPVGNMTVDPTTGALLGATIASFLPGAKNNTLSAVGDILSGAADLASEGFSKAKDFFSKNGGLATPLMKEGGMVPHFANGGGSQILSGLDDLISSTPAKGALFGALISQLLTAQAQSQAANAYRGIDMSKVGVIPPRTTMVSPVRFAPYRQYASAPEIPKSISSPIDIGALRASQTPMTSFTPTQGMVNPLARPLNTIMPTPMADGGAAYYTYGQSVDPLDYLRQNGMAYGGLAHGGLHEPHHADNAPIVQGRKDYRAGSAVTGPGDGQSDDIPAMLADGEYVFDADTVAQLGNGSTKAGSKILDRFREELRSHKRSAPVNKIPPPSKSPLAYLAAAQKKMKGA